MRRVVAAVVVVAAVLLAAAGAIHEKRKHDAAALSRRLCRESVQRRAAQRTLDAADAAVVVVGDSFAEGEGVPTVAQSWPRLLGMPVRVVAYAGSGYTQNGVCGSGRFLADLARPAARVVLEGGLNDVHASLATLRADVDRTVARLPERSIVVGPPDAPLFPRAAEQRVAQVIAAAARGRGLTFVSLMDMPAADFAGDREHPTVAGERWVAEEVSRAVRTSRPA